MNKALSKYRTSVFPGAPRQANQHGSPHLTVAGGRSHCSTSVCFYADGGDGGLIAIVLYKWRLS